MPLGQIITDVRKGTYFDSVLLMKVSERIRGIDNVHEALLVMGTKSNKDLLKEIELYTDAFDVCTPNDLMIAIGASPEVSCDAILKQVDDAFHEKDHATEEVVFSSLQAAFEAFPGATLCQISIPGDFAAREASKAIGLGLDTLIFSDNVRLEDEKRVKTEGAGKGVLVMGPDCGVCNIDGAALALASIVPDGPVGIVGASGSGIQEVAALVARDGYGVSQAIGTGGKDLRLEIGAIGMLAGMAALEHDPQTRLILLIGKKPASEVAEKLAAAIQSCVKPVVVCFLGDRPEAWVQAGAAFAPTLDAAARIAVGLLKGEPPESGEPVDGQRLEAAVAGMRHQISSGGRYLRGVFGAGTFVAQAQLICSGMLSPIYSNSPFAEGIALDNPMESKANTLIDLGDEVFTKGRPHPVIDPLPYRVRIAKEVGDVETGVLLFDVVLGPATYANPAEYIVQSLAEAERRTGRKVVKVASVCGSELDPQQYSEQVKILEGVGVQVFSSSAEAAFAASFALSQKDLSSLIEEYQRIFSSSVPASLASRVEKGSGPEIARRRSLKVINIGVDRFTEALKAQGVETVQVNWRPPAGGDLDILKMLEDL